MGLAKSATEIAIDSLKQQQTPVSDGVVTETNISIIHPEIYRYFNVQSSDANEGLDNIVEWAKEGSQSPSQVLNKINNLEIKLGQPNQGETRISKLANWVRMSFNIVDVDNSYKRQLNGIKESHKKSLSEIESRKGEELGKLNAQIKNIEARYKSVYQDTKSRTMAEMTKIKSEYATQLNELKSMRSVYKGRK